MPAMGFLHELLPRKRAEVEERKRILPAAALPPRPETGHHRFVEALSRPGIRLICEVKRRSPSEGDLRPHDDVVARARKYRKAGAAAISVLTDGLHFGGSLDDLSRIRDEVPLPLLRKDFVVDPYQIHEAASAGADAVLLIVAALSPEELVSLVKLARSVRIEPLVEVHADAELDAALASGARVIGINNRDLESLDVSLDVSRRLLPRIPPGTLAVSESGIRSYAEIQELSELGAKAFLVGSHLMKQEDVLAAVQGLMGLV